MFVVNLGRGDRRKGTPKSRLTCNVSLLLALTSVAVGIAAPATAGAQGFAQPPPGTSVPPAGASRHDLGDRPGQLAPQVVDRAALRARLVANRAANLARFHAYRLGGVYPSNVFTAGSANVWRDQDGRFCAAATIIRASGELALVDAIAEDANFIRLADVTQGPVMDWILTSGLTQAELVLIQRPFRPVTRSPELAPVEPILVDSRLRAAETRRLAKLYREIETKLRRQQAASLEAALETLMQQPELARQLLAS